MCVGSCCKSLLWREGPESAPRWAGEAERFPSLGAGVGGTSLRWVMGSQVESGHACGRREVGAGGCLGALLSLPSGLLQVHSLPQTPVPSGLTHRRSLPPRCGDTGLSSPQNRSFLLSQHILSSRQARRADAHHCVCNRYNSFQLITMYR